MDGECGEGLVAGRGAEELRACREVVQRVRSVRGGECADGRGWVHGEACDLALVRAHGRLGDVLARRVVVCPHLGDFVGACRENEVRGTGGLAESDVVDFLGVAFEGGEDLVGALVVELDDLVVATGEELSWVGVGHGEGGDTGGRG